PLSTSSWSKVLWISLQIRGACSAMYCSWMLSATAGVSDFCMTVHEIGHPMNICRHRTGRGGGIPGPAKTKAHVVRIVVFEINTYVGLIAAFRRTTVPVWC